ncbi:MAG: FadR family transcriptional regulator [Bifidobacteriaceae bacterium]|nr:FadR family transcriptional regulator [Bifidobacteriaceae bacterium]
MVAEAGTERRPGLIEQIAEDMRERIVSGAWPVGSRVPTEPELAALVGAGRNTVREAVQALVHAGLLERRQGSGTYVLATSELPSAIERQFACASQREVLEVRQALEIVSASLAAQRRTQPQVEHLRHLLAQRTTAVDQGDLDSMVSADLALHRYIAEMTGNAVLAELYSTVLSAVVDNIRFNFLHVNQEGNSHEDLVEAIAQGDPAAAARQIEHYLGQMSQSLRGQKPAEQNGLTPNATC